MNKISLRLLLLCTAPLMLSACSSKKETFKNEMAQWIKAHPMGVDYCTSLNVPSEIGNVDTLFGEGGFYQPSPIFGDTAKHPILAIEKADTGQSPVLDGLVKAGLVRAEPLKYTEYSQDFQYIPGHTGQDVYKYTTTTRIAYVVTSLTGWQTETSIFNVASVPDTPNQQPQPKMLNNILTIPASANSMTPAFCGGTISVKEITEYTIPAAEMGQIVSEATATLTLSGLPAWISDPAIKPGLGTPPKAEYQAKADFVQTSNGWKLMDGVQAAGLFGTGSFGGL